MQKLPFYKIWAIIVGYGLNINKQRPGGVSEEVRLSEDFTLHLQNIQCQENIINHGAAHSSVLRGRSAIAKDSKY